MISFERIFFNPDLVGGTDPFEEGVIAFEFVKFVIRFNKESSNERCFVDRFCGKMMGDLLFFAW